MWSGDCFRFGWRLIIVAPPQFSFHRGREAVPPRPTIVMSHENNGSLIVWYLSPYLSAATAPYTIYIAKRLNSSVCPTGPGRCKFLSQHYLKSSDVEGSIDTLGDSDRPEGMGLFRDVAIGLLNDFSLDSLRLGPSELVRCPYHGITSRRGSLVAR